MAGPLSVEVELFPPDARRRDVDGCAKALLDALQAGGLYDDDSQIVKLQLEKLAPVPGGAVIVRVQKC